MQVDMAISGAHMGHGSASSSSTSSKTWTDMTIGEAIGKLKGGSPALGMPGITLGQILNAVKSFGTGDFAMSMKDIITAPQDPNGWTLHRTFKASDLCLNCTVLGVKADLVYENGTRVDISRGVYLHHHASLNMGKHTDVYWLNQCPNSQTTRFGINFQDFIPRLVPSVQILALATVDEYTNYFTSKDGKIDSGLPVNPDDNVYMMTEVVNYAKQDHKIYIQLDVEYVERKFDKETTYTSLSFTGGTTDGSILKYC
jgi:hypothetical protein